MFGSGDDLFAPVVGLWPEQGQNDSAALRQTPCLIDSIDGLCSLKRRQPTTTPGLLPEGADNPMASLPAQASIGSENRAYKTVHVGSTLECQGQTFEVSEIYVDEHLIKRLSIYKKPADASATADAETGERKQYWPPDAPAES